MATAGTKIGSISTIELTIRRQRNGRGFRYVKPDGKLVPAASRAKVLAKVAAQIKTDAAA